MDYNNQGSHQSRNWNILNWNIRGLNSDDKCNAIKAKIEESACSVYCIQETKRDNFDHSFIKKLAPKRFGKFEYSPWLDVRGDSQLVIEQVMKELSCHNAKMAAYCREVQ